MIILPKTLAIPFLGVIVSPYSFFTFGMSVLFLPDFIHEKLLIPLNSSRIRCVFSCFSAHFSQVVSVSFRNPSSFFNEPSDLDISPVFFAFSFVHRCSCGVCVLTQMVCYCGSSNDTSFRLLQRCRRLNHFRLLCGSCSFSFLLDFPFEFSVALFEHVCFTRSHFFIVLTFCFLCCWGFLLFDVRFFGKLLSSML